MPLIRDVAITVAKAATVVTTTVAVGCSENDAGDRYTNVGDAGRMLDAGGAVVAPFTCPRDSIQGEPLPASIVLEQLRAAAELDVLEERAAFDTNADAGVRPPSERAGTPCATATDRTTCESAFAELSSGGEALRPPFDESDFIAQALEPEAKIRGYYLAYTKGDTVGKVSNETELRALFPSVDTPAKALLYSNAKGYRVECHQSSGGIREEPDGWVIVASRGHAARCSRTDVVLWLKRDGTIEERDVIENQEDPCT